MRGKYKEKGMPYCPDCGKFMRKINGNFYDGRVRYIKYNCDNCPQIHKDKSLTLIEPEVI